MLVLPPVSVSVSLSLPVSVSVSVSLSLRMSVCMHVRLFALSSHVFVFGANSAGGLLLYCTGEAALLSIFTASESAGIYGFRALGVYGS